MPSLLVCEHPDSDTLTTSNPIGNNHHKSKNPMSELIADIKNQIMND